jgi:hypothetical protein
MGSKMLEKEVPRITFGPEKEEVTATERNFIIRRFLICSFRK